MIEVAPKPRETVERPSLPFDYLHAKVLVPSPRPGSVWRTALVNRLRASRSYPLVTLVGPAGSGKTTVLAQWAERDERPFSWVSIDMRDNDSLLLLRHVAAAIHRVVPLDAEVARALRARPRSIWTSAVPKLTAAIASFDTPFTLVLDEASRLSSTDSLELLSVLARHMPEHSTLVLAGRSRVGFPVASFRAAGQLLEVGPALLAFNGREAESLVRAAGIELSESQLSGLLERTEGWAAGLYLCALAMRQDGSDLDVTGDDPFLADYFRTVCLGEVPAELVEFLRRTSILETISGPVCDAILRRTGSQRELELLDGANLFLVPLDRTRTAYRYHRLFRQLLLREVNENEPERVSRMHRLAAEWFEANAWPDCAIAHAVALGDVDRVARLVGSYAIPVCDAGAVEEVERWVRLFSEAELARRPTVALVAAWLKACGGRDSEARHLLELAESSGFTAEMPDGSSSWRVWARLLRAAMCDDGLERAFSDTGQVLAELSPQSFWRPTALLLRGVMLLLLGDVAGADDVLAAAGETSEQSSVSAAAWTYRAAIAEQRGDLARAEQLAQRARPATPPGDDDPFAARLLRAAILARCLLRSGRSAEAREELMPAVEPGDATPHGLSWLAAQAELELTRTFMAMRDRGGARERLAAARELLSGPAAPPALLERASELGKELEELQNLHPGNSSGLTHAELRLIPLLASHLSFREIGDHFSVTRNTVKSQALSVYRKLGASSRSEAIEKAACLGLIESTAVVAASAAPRVLAAS